MDKTRLGSKKLQSASVSRRDLLKSASAAGIALSAAGLVGRPGAFAAPAPAGRSAATRFAPPAADTKGSLSIAAFGGDAENKMFGAAVERFKARYPNVSVKLNISTVASWGDYANKLTTQIAGGNIPDVIEIAIEGTRLCVAKGLLEPLDDWVKDDADITGDLASISQPLKDAFTVDSKLYQLPNGWNNMVIWYNTKMFGDAGLSMPTAEWTWDDFLNAAKALTKGDGKDKIYGFAVPWGGMFQLMPWWLTNGTYPLNDAWTESNLSDPKILEAVTFIHDLIHVHKVAPSIQGTDAGQLFASSKVAMSGWGHWIYPTLKSAKFTTYDVQYWPRKTTATTVFGVGGFGMSPKTKDKALAWELVKELSGKQVNEDFAANGAGIPALKSVADTPAFLSDPANAKIFFESLNDAKPVPAPANFNQFEQIVMRHLGDIMGGNTSPEKGLQAADKELVDAMKKLSG